MVNEYNLLLTLFSWFITDKGKHVFSNDIFQKHYCLSWKLNQLGSERCNIIYCPIKSYSEGKFCHRRSQWSLRCPHGSFKFRTTKD